MDLKLPKNKPNIELDKKYKFKFNQTLNKMKVVLCLAFLVISIILNQRSTF